MCRLPFIGTHVIERTIVEDIRMTIGFEIALVINHRRFECAAFTKFAIAEFPSLGKVVMTKEGLLIACNEQCSTSLGDQFAKFIVGCFVLFTVERIVIETRFIEEYCGRFHRERLYCLAFLTRKNTPVSLRASDAAHRRSKIPISPQNTDRRTQNNPRAA